MGILHKLKQKLKHFKKGIKKIANKAVCHTETKKTPPQRENATATELPRTRDFIISRTEATTTTTETTTPRPAIPTVAVASVEVQSAPQLENPSESKATKTAEAKIEEVKAEEVKREEKPVLAPVEFVVKPDPVPEAVAVPSPAPKLELVTTAPLSLFSTIQPLPNKYKNTPTGQLIELADSMRLSFAKFNQDPAMSKGLAQEYTAFDKIVRELHTSVEKDESERKNYQPDPDLMEKKQEIDNKVSEKSTMITFIEKEAHAAATEITNSRNLLIQKQIELAEKTAEDLQPFMADHVGSYEADIKELADTMTKMPRKKTCFFECSPSEEYEKLRLKHEAMKANLKALLEKDLAKAKDAAAHVLQHCENKLVEAEKLLPDLNTIKTELEELKSQATQVADRIRNETDKHARQVGRTTMLNIVRLLEFFEMKMEGFPVLQSVIGDKKEKFMSNAKSFYCPSMNDFTLQHFRQDFRSLCANDKNAIVNGEISDVLLDNFMPEYPAQQQQITPRMYC